MLVLFPVVSRFCSRIKGLLPQKAPPAVPWRGFHFSLMNIKGYTRDDEKAINERKRFYLLQLISQLQKDTFMAHLPESIKESLLLGIAIVEATVVDEADMLDAIDASYTSEEREAALLATLHVAIGTIQKLTGESDPTEILRTFRTNLLNG